MKRPVEIRTPPRDWEKVLKISFPFLREHGIGDLLLYGSQAMSVYMKTPLRSKDLDLVTSQMGPRQLESLRKELGNEPSLEVRSSTIQSKTLTSGEMKIYSIELRISGRPFIVEVLDKVLDGKPPSVVTPHVQSVRKWGLDLWVPSPNAVVSLRLSFRPPEGISPLNCNRLNVFIRDQGKKVQPRTVGRLIREWGMTQVVKNNIDQLRTRHKLKVVHEREILAATEE